MRRATLRSLQAPRASSLVSARAVQPKWRMQRRVQVATHQQPVIASSPSARQRYVIHIRIRIRICIRIRIRIRRSFIIPLFT